MKDKKLSLQMMQIAERDINSLFGMLDNPEVFDDAVFGFHAQQAVEKILKAILTFNGIEYKRTHDLQTLFLQTDDAGVEFSIEIKNLEELTSFAVEFRYDLFIEDETLNRKEIYDTIKELQQIILEAINK
ncbi:MAG: HEPN domain-containing protein [Ignavibacteriota bacterium]